MKTQTIISISREYGSGGHEIAEIIAEKLSLPLYDRKILDDIAKEKNVDVAHLQKMDEKPRNPMLSRRVRGYSSSPEENLVQMQFEYLQKKAASGESFVVVGRCSEWALRENPGLITVFITGDKEEKRERIMKKYKLSHKEAKTKIERHDKKRKTYHNTHCEFKWGDSRHYDVCMNSNRLGVQRTAEVLEEYINRRVDV